MRSRVLPFLPGAVSIVAALFAVGGVAGPAGGSVQAAGTVGGGAAFPHVTLIGDSVATGIEGEPAALRILRQGIDLDLETQPCRRLEDASCPPNPPTAIDVIHSLGAAIGPTVVIAVGYNDFQDRYQAEIADTLAALDGAGVKRIFWLTLRAAHHPYLAMNDEITAAAAAQPGMTVVDWNTYSRSHPEWFQSDGLHLLSGGAVAMATLVHQALATAGIAVPPPRVTTVTLAVGRRGVPYLSHLAAASGQAPYRWSLTGRLPAGLHLQAVGRLDGTPRRSDRRGTYTVVLAVRDALGQTGTRKVLLHLR